MSCVTWLPKSMMRMRSSVMFRSRISWGGGIVRGTKAESTGEFLRFPAGCTEGAQLAKPLLCCGAIAGIKFKMGKAAQRRRMRRVDGKRDQIIFPGEILLVACLMHGAETGECRRIGRICHDCRFEEALGFGEIPAIRRRGALRHKRNRSALRLLVYPLCRCSAKGHKRKAEHQQGQNKDFTDKNGRHSFRLLGRDGSDRPSFLRPVKPVEPAHHVPAFLTRMAMKNPSVPVDAGLSRSAPPGSAEGRAAPSGQWSCQSASAKSVWAARKAATRCSFSEGSSEQVT